MSLSLVANQAISSANPVVLSGSILGYQFAITTSQLIYWGIAAIVGIVAETLVGWRLPFGIIGALLASLLGIWLLTDVIPLNISVDNFTIAGQSIPLIKALLGAVIVVALWHMLTYPAWRDRHRYYRGYRREYRRRYRRDYDY